MSTIQPTSLARKWINFSSFSPFEDRPNVLRDIRKDLWWVCNGGIGLFSARGWDTEELINQYSRLIEANATAEHIAVYNKAAAKYANQGWPLEHLTSKVIELIEIFKYDPAELDQYQEHIYQEMLISEPEDRAVYFSLSLRDQTSVYSSIEDDMGVPDGPSIEDMEPEADFLIEEALI